MKAFLNRIPQYFYGKKRFQPFFERLHQIALRGQNYYNAVDLRFTGEIKVIEYFLSKEGDRPLVIFDVGTHEGKYIDLILTRRKKQLYIHGFEPQKECINQLNIKFQQDNFIHINHLAISNSQEQEVDLYSCSNNNLVAMVDAFKLEDFNPNLALDRKESVASTTIKNYCLSKGINQIDFLKLDAEGLEYQCLEGCEDMLDLGKIKYIQFEYCFINMARKNYFRDFWLLLSQQYDIYRVVIDGLYLINEYHLNLEVMAPINYLAVLKSKV